MDQWLITFLSKYTYSHTHVYVQYNHRILFHIKYDIFFNTSTLRFNINASIVDTSLYSSFYFPLEWKKIFYSTHSPYLGRFGRKTPTQIFIFNVEFDDVYRGIEYTKACENNIKYISHNTSSILLYMKISKTKQHISPFATANGFHVHT